MACNCKHSREDIERGYADFAKLRALFIKRMTEDSETHDRRKREYNQAIFVVYSDEEVDSLNASITEMNYALGFNTPLKPYGYTVQAWDKITMDMVLKCFDDAVKDWRRMFCDVENCRRKP